LDDLVGGLSGLRGAIGRGGAAVDDVAIGAGRLASNQADGVITFYRGTTRGSVLEVVSNQALDIRRIAANQRLNPGVARPGIYLTRDLATAADYATLAGAYGRGMGPGILKVDVSADDFADLVRKRGLTVDTPVPNPPFPGQTETVIPFEVAAEFDRIARYSQVP
jgi:hypothetical protein